MRKNAKTCNDYIAEISNSDGALSKELMEHCMQCRDCRQELKRQLAAADRDELRSCRRVWPSACRPPAAILGLVPAAAIVASLALRRLRRRRAVDDVLMLETAPAPSGGSHDSEAESLAADWDGRDIIEQIEWIGLAIEQIRMDMAGDWTDNDSATHVTNEE